MLIKKKILEAELPKVKKNCCIARVFQIKDSGRVFIMDIFSRYGNKKYKYRAACDGKNSIIYDYINDMWISGRLWNIGIGWNCRLPDMDEGTTNAVKRFFKSESSAFSTFDSWQYRHSVELREKREERQLSLQERRLKMFPKTGTRILKWCEKEVFKNYIFLSSAVKGERVARCYSCGEVWHVGTTEHKHKEEGMCPHCKRDSIYFLQRHQNSILNKDKINIWSKKDGYILSKWSKVIRYFNDKGESVIEFSDYWYTGIPISGGKDFYYGEVVASYCANYIGRKKWATPAMHPDAKVYKGNLNRVVAEYVNGFDVASIIDFIRNPVDIIKNLKYRPQTEYLLKLGLYNLADSADILRPAGEGFEGVLGISKQYLPMYQKLNPDISAHLSIQDMAEEEYISEELAKIIIKRNIRKEHIDGIRNLSGKGSIGKIIRYINKQDFSGYDFLSEYRDYFSMAKQLGFELKHKYDIWPKNLREEHDKLSEKVNILKDKLAEKEFLEKTSELYKTIPKEFSNKKYLIRLPEHAGDFGAEGQNLKICVGSYGYRDSHIAGRSLICFIRKIDNPDESYVCCEISLKNYKVMQVHGYKNDVDKPLPEEVKKFAKEYAEKIKRFRKEIA